MERPARMSHHPFTDLGMRDSALADGVGFEPTNPCGLAVFKTAALNHSATHPDQAAMPLALPGAKLATRAAPALPPKIAAPLRRSQRQWRTTALSIRLIDADRSLDLRLGDAKRGGCLADVPPRGVIDLDSDLCTVLRAATLRLARQQYLVKTRGCP